MDILHVIVGLFLIGLGFLVKSSPDLIVGYNTMPEEKKKNVDINGLSTYMRNAMIVMGVSIIVGYFLFKWAGFMMLANAIILIVTVFGGLIMVINARKYDRNKDQKSWQIFLVFGLTIAFVIALTAYGLIPSKMHITDDAVRFSGMYGVSIPMSAIETVYLSAHIPAIKARTNGYSFGATKKGFFNLDEWGRTRLLIHSDQPRYVIISKSDGSRMIFNFKDAAATEAKYQKIKVLLEEYKADSLP